MSTLCRSFPSCVQSSSAFPACVTEGCGTCPGAALARGRGPAPTARCCECCCSAVAALLNYGLVFLRGMKDRILGAGVPMGSAVEREMRGGSLLIKATLRLCECWETGSHPCSSSCSYLGQDKHWAAGLGDPHLVLSAPDQPCQREPPLPQYTESLAS